MEGGGKNGLKWINSLAFQMNFINTITEGVEEKELIQIIYEQRIWLLLSVVRRIGSGGTARKLQTLSSRLFLVALWAKQIWNYFRCIIGLSKGLKVIFLRAKVLSMEEDTLKEKERQERRRCDKLDIRRFQDRLMILKIYVHLYMCVCVHVLICIYFLALSNEWVWYKNIPVTTWYLTPRFWFLLPFPSNRNWEFLEKCVIPEPWQGRCKINLKYLVVPKSKEVLKTNTTDGRMLQGYRRHLGGALTGLVWNNLNTSKT